VPRLILLNGAPANGKSTLARMYVEDHPLALNLDIDQVRAMLGRWRDDAGTAGLRARAIALAAARVHLLAGYDVVIPQLVARPEFLEDLAALADGAGAVFHEIVMRSPWDHAWRRLGERTSTTEASVPVTEAALTEFYDRLAAILPTRRAARIVDTVDGDLAGTYRLVLACLSP
jgi:predicted kinase